MENSSLLRALNFGRRTIWRSYGVGSKRITNVKDYGVILPGHGGILDRLDSIVFAFAFTYLFCMLGGMFLV